MKLKEYIASLQKLLDENGDSDITVRTKRFHQNLDIDENYSARINLILINIKNAL